MNSPNVSLSFKFYALRYLLLWLNKEAALYKKMNEPELELGEIRKSLKHFGVSRSFKDLKNKGPAEKIRTALLEVRALETDEVEKVIILAEKLSVKFKKNNLSASSKLLWLSERAPFIIYDSRARTGLSQISEYSPKAGDYVKYSELWRAAFKSNKDNILNAVNRLPEVISFLPANKLTEKQLLVMVKKTWFLERVFDNYLWELGGEGYRV